MSSVLIVDDSRFARRMTRRLFEELGHSVEEAAGGTEALARYAAGRHDLVTLDLLMPEMDGATALVKLREINPAVKTIVATADIQASTRRELEALGASAIIHKPINLEELKRLIASVLETSHTPC